MSAKTPLRQTNAPTHCAHACDKLSTLRHFGCHIFPQLPFPYLVAQGRQVQAVGGKVFAQNVGAPHLQAAEHVDVHDALVAAVSCQERVDLRYFVSLPHQWLPPAETLVYREQTLDVKLGRGRLRPDGVDNGLAAFKNLLGRDVLCHVVRADKQEDGLGMMRSDLAQAVDYPFRVVAYNAVIHHIGHAEACAPVLAQLGVAVAQHHYRVGVNVPSRLKLNHFLIVVARELVRHLL